MRFKVEWTQEDLENILRQSLQESGFHIPAEEQFRWYHRPKLRVTIEVEPAQKKTPEKTVKDVLSKPAEEPVATNPVPTAEEWDATLLPSGVDIDALRRLEKVMKERNKK